MTATPETWDDVGCLRLKVDCISDSFEDFKASQGLSVSQLQKLKDEVEILSTHLVNKDKKSKGQVQACLTASAVLFLCLIGVFALQVFIIYTGWASRWAQNPMDEAWKTDEDGFKDSGASTLTNKENQRSTWNGSWNPLKKIEQYDAWWERVGVALKHRNDHHQKKMSASQAAARRREEKALLAELRHAEAAEEAKNSAKMAAKDDSGDEHKQSPQTHQFDVVGDAGKQPLNPPQTHQFNVVGAGRKQRETIVEGELPSEIEITKKQEKSLKTSLPVQVSSEGVPSSLESPSRSVSKQTRRSMFWVCFPSKGLKKNVRKYAPVFNEISESQRFMVYPFCYLNSKKVNLDPEADEHFCDDVDKTIFVLEMEKTSDAITDKDASRRTPPISTFEDCNEWARKLTESPQFFDKETGFTKFTSPTWYQRVLPEDQDISVSVVKDFLNDAYSGKIQEALPRKRDL